MDDDIPGAGSTGEPDFYSTLNLRRDASEAEVRRAFSELSVRMHPDKQPPAMRQEAAEAFEPVVQAYDVLRDPVARAVYDKDGVAGVHLLRNRLVVRPYSTVDAVKNRVDRILKQQAQAKLLSENFSTTQARAVIIAKNILYPQALPQTPRRQGLRPVNSILGPLFLSHTVRVRSTPTTLCELTGAVQYVPYKAAPVPSLSAAVRQAISENVDINIGASTGPEHSIGVTLTRKDIIDNVNLNVGVQFSSASPNPVIPDLTVGADAQLSENSTGHVQWTVGHNPAMSFSASHALGQKVKGKKRKYKLTLSADLSMYGGSHLSMRCVRRLSENVRVFAGLGLSTADPLTLQAGLYRLLCPLNVFEMYCSVGVASGVMLHLALNRLGSRYEVPILINDSPTPGAIVAGCALPYLCYRVVRLLFKRRGRARRQERLLQESTQQGQALLHRREVALKQQKMLRAKAEQIRAEEHSKDGLVITSAIFGKLDRKDDHQSMDRHAPGDDVEADADFPLTIDVTIPLQALVKNSELVVLDASYASLIGFYKPSEEVNRLSLTYTFRNIEYMAMFHEDEPIKLPDFRHLRLRDMA